MSTFSKLGHLVVTLAGLVGLVACTGAPAGTPTSSATSPSVSTTSASRPATPANSVSGSQTSAPTSVSCDYPAAGTPAKAVEPPSTTNVPAVGTVTYTLMFTAGDVVVTMDRANAPCAVHSFESLASQGYFDGTSCHRLVDAGIYVLQCGDPTGTGQGGPGYRFADELHGTETYPAGTVAMANAGPGTDTNGSQFFLVYADTVLKPDYTILGRMDQAGIDVIGGIAAQGVDAANSPAPIAPADITSVTAG